MTMNTHDYQPIAIKENTLEAIEEWADRGMLSADQVQMVMNKCGEIVKYMLENEDENAIRGHANSTKSQRHEILLRCIATLDRLHEAVKLNHRRVDEVATH